ncbi:hypothetical protein IE81DRAFT_361990 [Ceraceosorus guamensis]|uniref:Uncharacterized protein n=1 Tax=Ceraceosorus guamensis TaxID=1522189 RepID=A0A316VSI9_9BASI|nr:hypothetical protein IE81DRAFT_361990 [Ceraceosorus guamensis]PWN40184.1 hypothetical protein IE81DRAFT_361990 [Ceraceosorus guamensis]
MLAINFALQEAVGEQVLDTPSDKCKALHNKDLLWFLHKASKTHSAKHINALVKNLARSTFIAKAVEGKGQVAALQTAALQAPDGDAFLELVPAIGIVEQVLINLGPPLRSFNLASVTLSLSLSNVTIHAHLTVNFPLTNINILLCVPCLTLTVLNTSVTVDILCVIINSPPASVTINSLLAAFAHPARHWWNGHLPKARHKTILQVCALKQAAENAVRRVDKLMANSIAPVVCISRDVMMGDVLGQTTFFGSIANSGPELWRWIAKEAGLELGPFLDLFAHTLDKHKEWLIFLIGLLWILCGITYPMVLVMLLAEVATTVLKSASVRFNMIANAGTISVVSSLDAVAVILPDPGALKYKGSPVRQSTLLDLIYLCCLKGCLLQHLAPQFTGNAPRLKAAAEAQSAELRIDKLIANAIKQHKTWSKVISVRMRNQQAYLNKLEDAKP